MSRPRLTSSRSAARSSAAARSSTGVAAQAGKPAAAARHRGAHDGLVGLGHDADRSAVDRRHQRRARCPGSATPSTSGAALPARSAKVSRRRAPRRNSASRLARSPNSTPAEAAPLRLIKVARQRNFAVARLLRVGDAALRPAQNFRDRHVRIGGDRDERRIGAVLQKPPHQISEQIAIAADRRIDAAGGVGKFGEQRIVERFAHAVEPLKLETLDAAGVFDHAGDGERVMGGELRKQPSARGEQFFDAGHVAEVGHGLAGEHRIIGKPRSCARLISVSQ